MDEKIFRILPIENILSDPSLHRKKDREPELGRFQGNTREIGKIQPLTVIYAGGGDYKIVSGERRFDASVKAGLSSVPCVIVKDFSEYRSSATASGNIKKKKLNFFEQADRLAAFMKKLNLTPSETAKKLGYSQTSVENKLKLLKIPKDVRNFIVTSGITERQARAFSELEAEDCFDFAKYIAKNKIDSSETEYLVSEYIKNNPPKKRKTKIRGYCSDMRLYINSLNRTLGLLKSSGLASGSKREEFEDKYVYTFVINKDTI